MLSDSQRAAHRRRMTGWRWGLGAIVMSAALVGVVAAAGSASGASTDGQVSLTGGAAGRWLVARAGGVTSLGSSATLAPGQAGTVGGASDPAGRGIITTTATGLVTAHGNIGWAGDLRAFRLNQPIVDAAVTPSGNGYWLVASDGGVFAFGDAGFHGSTGHIVLNQPIVGIAPTPSGAGYWLVASDGGIFAFGNAAYHGSLADHWTDDIIAVSATAHGYALADSSGRVTEFGTSKAGLLNDAWSAPALTDETAIAAEVFERMNAERVARGVRPLLWDVRLAATATDWSATMSVSGFRHSDVSAIATRLGGYAGLAENIYRGTFTFADAGSAHVGFMNSPEHRHTLLAPGYTTAAVGVVCDAAGQLWVTVHFGTPHGHAPGLGRPPTTAKPVATPDLNGARCG